MKIGIINDLSVTPTRADFDAVAGDGWYDATILVGGSSSIAHLSEQLDQYHILDVVVFKPWSHVDKGMEFSPRQFAMRNRQIVDNADVILFIVEAVYDNAEDYDTEVSAALRYASDTGVHYIVAEHRGEEG